MDKLIELLNEYQNGKEKSEQAKEYEVYKWELDSRGGIARYDTDDPREGYNLYSDVTPSYLTSKSFGFIQWLVENEKLKWTDKMEMRKIMLGMPEKQDYYLMMLAVHPEPIEFLISILK